ncbi:uncharacterized protein LOC128952280 isoform X2 [Oppia nitens]|uniref:uncharacterized protein LOC128952280 isoform X2 n=1 Tax=Oppia nitens TaxID=1686743 RepID=UPI0023DBA42E|nr:uncharacterized protein LOC128952280 isoform X2 [Oppia nitens]
MIFLLLLCLVIHHIVIASDPDVDICNKPSINAGVYSDDGYSYIFKDNYYWRTKDLDKFNGIIGFSDLVANKWPDIVGNIITVFTLPQSTSQNLITVYVVNRWFSYENGNYKQDGSTNTWPQFADIKITAAFNKEYMSPKVFILHNNSNNFNLYDFTSIKYPSLLSTGTTNINDKMLFFIESDANSSAVSTLTTLTALINPIAALTYDKNLVLIAIDKSCTVKLTDDRYMKQCDPNVTTTALFSCPLNLNQRPVTTGTITTVISSGGDSQPNNTILVSNTTITSEQKSVAQSDSSSSWPYIVIVVTIVGSVVSIGVVVLVYIFSRKTSKGEVIYIDNSHKELSIGSLQVKTQNSNTSNSIKS